MPGKKSFKGSPAMQFITPQPDQTAATTPAGKPPEGYKLNPLYIETRSRRVQLILQPSLYEKVRAAAAEQGVSFNDLVHTILEREMEKGATDNE